MQLKISIERENLIKCENEQHIKKFVFILLLDTYNLHSSFNRANRNRRSARHVNDCIKRGRERERGFDRSRVIKAVFRRLGELELEKKYAGVAP